MLRPDMFEASIKPYKNNKKTRATVLAMQIENVDQYLSPNIVKIIHNLDGDILYTTRSPVPYTKKFSKSLNARRIYGIFTFRWDFLQFFSSLKESPLEIKESCDSNRLYDHGYTQKIAPYKFINSFSVDSLNDLKIVEKYMPKDKIWNIYRKKIIKQN